ncbi:MAG: hypothetical protein IKR97_08240 [Eubacterium sp.]|nr:hypothetical protein [Eubacterium sp.]
MKKTLSIILAVLMLISVLPMSVSAAEKPNRSDSELSVYDGKAKKTHYLYDELGTHKSKISGLSYSLSSNTLTISSVKNDKLRIDASEMGSKFKIKVIGSCEIARLNVLFGGLTITGSGTLTINEKKKNDYAIMGDSLNPFTVDKNVSLKLYAKKYVLHLTYCKKKIFSFKNGDKPSIKSTPEYCKELYGYVDSQESSGYNTVYETSTPGVTYGAHKTYVDNVESFDVYKYLYSETLDKYFRDEYSSEPEAEGTYEDLQLYGYTIQKDKNEQYVENGFNETHYINLKCAVDSKGKEYVFDSSKNVYEIIEIPELYNHYHVWEDEGAHEYLPYGISTVYYFKKTSAVKYEDLKKVYNTDIDSYTHSIKKTSLVIVGKPKSAKLSKVSALRGGFKASWKKVSSISGYQIQYATNSKFTKGKKTIKVSKSSTSKSVGKLKRHKTYYARIRTYKTVGGKTKYSSWSGYKKVKTN